MTYVGGIERGKRNPSLALMGRIAAAFDTDPCQLLRRLAQARARTGDRDAPSKY